MNRRLPVVLASVLACGLPPALPSLAAPGEPPGQQEEARARERAAARRMAEVLIREEEARRKRLAEQEAAAAQAAPAVTGMRPAPGPAADRSLDQVFGQGMEVREPARDAREQYPSAFAVSSEDENMQVEDVRPEPRVASLPAPARPSPTTVAAGEDGLELFHTGYSRFSQGDYPRARAAFEAFLRRQPGHDLADSAQYWIGECAYAQGDLDGALQEYRKVIDSFPFGSKVADALLKSGYVLLEQGRTQEARRLLTQLVEDHPESGAAQRAAQRLREAGLAPAVQ